MTAYHMCHECIRPLLTQEDISRGYHKTCYEEVNRRRDQESANHVMMMCIAGACA